MRLSTIIAGALSIATASSTYAGDSNILLNGGFEDPGPGFVLFQNWMNFGNVFADESVEVSPFEGTTSGKMFGASNGSQSDQVLLQTVTGITPGQTYTLSSRVLNPSGDAIGGENVILIQMNFEDSGGGLIERIETDAIDIENDPFDTWIETSVMGIAPAGTTQITIALLHIQLGTDAGFPNQEGGASFWDDIQLTEGEPPCDNQADLNGDGVLNFFDVSLFLQEFNRGCP